MVAPTMLTVAVDAESVEPESAALPAPNTHPELGATLSLVPTSVVPSMVIVELP